MKDRKYSVCICLVAVAAALAAGCASATLVTPAPISADQIPQLQAALLGSCQVLHRKSPGGDMKNAKGLHFVFTADGKFIWRMDTPFGTAKNEWTYQLDGRNIVNTSSFKTIRVDDWKSDTLELFVYDISETYYCTKEPAAT